MARPTKYDEKFCDEIIKYFDVEPYEKTTKTVASGGRAVEVEALEATDFPSFAGFAKRIGVHRETLLNWCDEHPKFFDAYKKAKVMQEEWSLVNGHKGLVNTAFAIFCMKNLQNYKDKQEVEQTGESVKFVIERSDKDGQE